MIDSHPSHQDKPGAATPRASALLLAVLVGACSTPSEKLPPPKQTPHKAAVSDSKPSLESAVERYAAVHDALAHDDAARARTAFGELAPQLKSASAAATTGAGSDDIAVQRKAFHEVSLALMKRIRAEGNPSSGELHVAQCPMAFNNTGAQWIQSTKRVANPYFGASMFGCGGIEESFPAKS